MSVINNEIFMFDGNNDSESPVMLLRYRTDLSMLLSYLSDNDRDPYVG